MAAARKTRVRGRPARATRVRQTRPASGMRSPAWWLLADIEVCTFCHQKYAYGTGYRCVECDVAVCGFCAEYRGQEVRCPEC